ncbi:MAG: NHL repeat-containing [Rhodospirillaceae bacterium]|nr:MAG: NHL repeat-containing [Rhodospirillaceae bacterium]TNC94630.1 MAG: NHL repeat-containing protein [Stygiobacter sp.]
MFGLTRAPELAAAGLTWFNVDQPLSLARLRGKLVILDFWTFCCVNCFHTLPVLKDLETRFANELAVIGVHSPKFDHERDPAMVASAIARYDITHPVVHDPDLYLWENYCIRAWPTLVLISPDSRVIGQLAGEPHPDRLPQGIEDMIERFFAMGKMRPAPTPCQPVSDPGGRLRFPGKIKRGTDGVWALADCGHHQVVLLDDHGGEIARFGSGLAGRDDGMEASFNGPEGVAIDRDFLYVADTRNHLIRRIDRLSGATATIAGQGWRGGTLGQAAPGLETALASPWDMEVHDGTLYFANAGSHQLGALDLGSGMVRRLAGSGGENLGDGEAGQCLLAQPSGLALCDDGRSLYFADAETSALRRLCLTTGRVDTLVGQGLFDFGHKNGPLAEARLQHPLGVSCADGRLFVADSYNHAIRVVDPVSGLVSDLGHLPLDICEPAGIATDGANRLLVSDTNNHRIIEVDLRANTVRAWAA